MESGFAAPKLLLCCLVMVEACRGAVLFSSLPRALNVSASPKPGQVLRTGEDTMTVAWSLNFGSSALAAGESGKHIKALLCYAPVSQVDRPWRKTVNNLRKDKTCQFTIFTSLYDAVSMSHGRVTWLVEKDVPGATYFVRAYLYGPNGGEVAFGESSDLFEIEGISGIHWQLKVVSACGSMIPLVSLVVLWLLEKRNKKGDSKS